MQVELAMLQYKLNRLGSEDEFVVVEKEMEQLDMEGANIQYAQVRKPVQGEGIGFRGAGETKLELDKRQIKARISELKKEIFHFGSQRKLHRDAR
jgi:GTP-binding protein HflX